MVIYMLSETSEGWVLYDDEGRTKVLAVNLNSALLDAAKVMRDNGDPVQGNWALVSNEEFMTLRFTPAAYPLLCPSPSASSVWSCGCSEVPSVPSR